jgi:hypothetical protein
MTSIRNVAIDNNACGVDAKQVSAVQKIARVMPIKPGMKLYRGLGGTVSLPESFYHTDANGCRGFSEWGFMSTTSAREVHTMRSRDARFGSSLF